MSSHMSLLLCITLLCSLACQYQVHCSEASATSVQTNATLPEDNPVANGTDSLNKPNKDEEDVEEDDYDQDISVGYIIDDSIRVQPVVKPENTTKKNEKKNGEKKAKKAKNDKKKKKNPCLTTHKDFCIHGQCKYLSSIKEVTCRCQKDYSGERCSTLSTMSMKTHTSELGDVSTVALAVAAVLLSTISLVAIIIIIVIHTRRKYSTYDCEAEEKKKLGQENGSEEIDV
ncbi:amphiregulin [Pelobates fuscus]|uniref:amphiregulin n=1 Tax=Pelobates fuscus TaxID=191477 RepID=UPI002FE43AEC